MIIWQVVFEVFYYVFYLSKARFVTACNKGYFC